MSNIVREPSYRTDYAVRVNGELRKVVRSIDQAKQLAQLEGGTYEAFDNVCAYTYYEVDAKGKRTFVSTTSVD